MNQPTDWDPIYGHNKKLPPACCPKNWSVLSERGVKDCTIKDATKTGCKQKLVQFMKDHLIIWFVLGFTVVILVQVIFNENVYLRFCCQFFSLTFSVADYWNFVHLYLVLRVS